MIYSDLYLKWFLMVLFDAFPLWFHDNPHGETLTHGMLMVYCTLSIASGLYIWLVVEPYPLWKMMEWKSVGITIPKYMETLKKYSKPPTSKWYIYIYTYENHEMFDVGLVVIKWGFNVGLLVINWWLNGGLVVNSWGFNCGFHGMKWWLTEGFMGFKWWFNRLQWDLVWI